MKVDEKRNEQLDKRMKECREHVDYVNSVSASQEMKKTAYLASLEKSLDKASKRKEEAVAKVVEVAKEDKMKVEKAKLRREKQNQASMDEVFESKMEERNRNAELVRQTKLRL